MADDQAPVDVLAEISKAIGEPALQDGASSGVFGDQQSASSDDLPSEFQDNPADAPDLAALKKELRATMTRRTQGIADERKKIKEQAAQYEKDRRDAEMFRALKDAQDPAAAAKALVGERHSPNGIVDPDAVLRKHQETFDAPTYEGIKAIAEAIWLQKAQQELLPDRQALRALLGERHQSEQAKVIAEYGDEASKWMETARTLQQQNGLSLQDALLVASKGQVAFSKIRATVADARKRAATPPSVAPGSVVAPKKIGLSRDERTARIVEAAARAGNTQFSRP